MKTVLITGSGKRIGRGLALRFAKRGFNVIIHYYSSEEMAKDTYQQVLSMGVESYLVKGDLNDDHEISEFYRKIVDKFHEPDILINNAGVFPKAAKLDETEIALWDDTININLKSSFILSKLFAEHALDGSKIINIASLGAFHIWKNRIPYNVSKAGLVQLTKALARELAPRIAVNSVSPGTIVIEDEEAVEPVTVKKSSIPYMDYGSIDDVFEAVYFFATCTNFITGQNISVDGGFGLL